MNKLWKVFSALLILALVFVPAQSALARGLAQESDSGRIVFGSAFTLKSGETLEGDLLVVGGSAVIEAGATVNGTVVLLGGTLAIDGTVRGDLVAAGGAVTLGADALITGSMVVAGVALEQKEGARVLGEIITQPGVDMPIAPQIPAMPSNPTAPNPPSVAPFTFDFSPIQEVGRLLFESVALGVLAILVGLFLPEHTRRIKGAVVAQPMLSAGIGFVAMLATLALTLILTVTLILIPIALITLLVFVVALVLGWIALGLEVGERFAAALNQVWSPAFAAGVGTFLLTLVLNSIAFIPCLGWIAPFIFGMIGLGGIVLTQMGSRIYPTDASQTIITGQTAEEPIPPAS
jgi:cytoskeletal protein CcmA (bactofilin family)